MPIKKGAGGRGKDGNGDITNPDRLGKIRGIVGLWQTAQKRKHNVQYVQYFARC